MGSSDNAHSDRHCARRDHASDARQSAQIFQLCGRGRVARAGRAGDAAHLSTSLPNADVNAVRPVSVGAVVDFAAGNRCAALGAG